MCEQFWRDQAAAAVGVFFVGAGGLAGQVFPARAAASGAAAALLGAGLLARMVGDGVAALSGLRWLSPFGLLELSRPYAGDRWTPVLLLAAAAIALVAAAPAAARRRDVRGGWLTPAVGGHRGWRCSARCRHSRYADCCDRCSAGP